MLIDSEKLRKRAKIGKRCEDCPRFRPNGENMLDRCKGHLMWLCSAINEAEGECNGNKA